MRDSIPAAARRRTVDNIDTRVNNPTTDVFEQRIAAHEGGGAVSLLTHTLPRLGIRTRFTDIHDLDLDLDLALAAAVAADVGRTTTAGPQRSGHAA